MSGKVALVVGNTGLIGSLLLSKLLLDDRFSRVISFGRRKSGKSGDKLEEHVIDFEAPGTWRDCVRGDILFSALGTTVKQAGSQAAQKKVDYDYQLAFAEAAVANGVPSYVLVSAGWADAAARGFYMRIKGELDRDVQKLGFKRVRIFRPSVFDGDRKEGRVGEKIGTALLNAVSAIGIARKFRPIRGDVVAQAMINAALDEEKGARIFSLDEIFYEAL